MGINDNPSDVKLLSGGNPQVSKGDGDAPVEVYLAAMPGWKGEIGRRLDALVDEVVLDVCKAVRWNSPFYGVEGNGWFLSMHCFAKYVKVTWLNGSGLEPQPPKKATAERVRYLHITESDEIDDVQLRDWIRQAADLPGENLF